MRNERGLVLLLALTAAGAVAAAAIAIATYTPRKPRDITRPCIYTVTNGVTTSLTRSLSCP